MPGNSESAIVPPAASLIGKIRWRCPPNDSTEKQPCVGCDKRSASGMSNVAVPSARRRNRSVNHTADALGSPESMFKEQKRGDGYAEIDAGIDTLDRCP
jgi:hypothetical protein